MTLVEMRHRCGLTQAVAATRLGWVRQTLSYLEDGRPQVVARRNFGKIAKLYRVTWDEIAEAVEQAQRRARQRGKRGKRT